MFFVRHYPPVPVLGFSTSQKFTRHGSHATACNRCGISRLLRAVAWRRVEVCRNPSGAIRSGVRLGEGGGLWLSWLCAVGGVTSPRGSARERPLDTRVVDAGLGSAGEQATRGYRTEGSRLGGLRALNRGGFYRDTLTLGCRFCVFFDTI